MSDAFPTDPVADQYERWSYPRAPADLAALSFQSPRNYFKDLKELYWAYWPTAPLRQDLDILVAGCGTMAAAGYAYLFPQARVVGIDISAASLAHEALLKKKHALDNLTLRQCRIEDVASLGADFDYINAHGVLHHLADPAAGLRSLGGVLRPEGVIAIMIYAPYGRAGVYILQEFFRILGLRQDAEGVRIVRETLRALGPDHPLRHQAHLPIDVIADPSLVDTFLHARDQPYTVRQCLELVSAAGLAFQGWDENSFYHPDGRIPVGHPLHEPLGKLEGAALWQAMELLFGCLYFHLFHACRRARPEAHYRISFEGAAFLDYIPVPRATTWTPADPAAGQPATIARPSFPPLPLNDWQALLLRHVDGQRTIRACLGKMGPAGMAADLVESARAFFRSLWRVGYMTYRM